MLGAEGLQRRRRCSIMSGRYLVQFAPVDGNFDFLPLVNFPDCDESDTIQHKGHIIRPRCGGRETCLRFTVLRLSIPCLGLLKGYHIQISDRRRRCLEPECLGPRPTSSRPTRKNHRIIIETTFETCTSGPKRDIQFKTCKTLVYY